MATVINNPGSRERSEDSGATLVVVVLVLLIIGALFFTYGLPGTTTNVDRGTDVNLPGANVPDTIDVNVTTTNGGTGAPQQQ